MYNRAPVFGSGIGSSSGNAFVASGTWNSMVGAISSEGEGEEQESNVINKIYM
jgi:hypothetical protein